MLLKDTLNTAFNGITWSIKSRSILTAPASLSAGVGGADGKYGKELPELYSDHD